MSPRPFAAARCRPGEPHRRPPQRSRPSRHPRPHQRPPGRSARCRAARPASSPPSQRRLPLVRDGNHPDPRRGAVRQLQSSSRDITEQRDRTEPDQEGVPRRSHRFSQRGAPSRPHEPGVPISRRTGQPTGVLFIDLDKTSTTPRTQLGDTALTKVANASPPSFGPATPSPGSVVTVHLVPALMARAPQRSPSSPRRLRQAFVLEGREVSVPPSGSRPRPRPTGGIRPRAGRRRYGRASGKALGLIRLTSNSGCPRRYRSCRATVANNELRLHLAELDLDSGQIFEALVRWQRPDGNLTLPSASARWRKPGSSSNSAGGSSLRRAGRRRVECRG